MLVVEEPFYAQSLLSDNLKKLTREIKTWGKWKGLAVRSYAPPMVKAFFCRDQKTKQSLAEAMIERYPFLSRYLTNLPWRRRYWFHVFDAVGLGLMCVRKMRHYKISPRHNISFMHRRRTRYHRTPAHVATRDAGGSGRNFLVRLLFILLILLILNSILCLATNT